MKAGMQVLPPLESPINFNEKSRLDFELLISEISSSLVNPSADEIDSVIEAGLQKMLDLLHVDRASLFQKDEMDCQRFILTHVKIRPGCGPQEKPFLTTDSFPWMTSQYLMGRETKYSRINDLPE